MLETLINISIFSLLADLQNLIVSLLPFASRCRALPQRWHICVLPVFHQRQFEAENQFCSARLRRFGRLTARLHHLSYNNRFLNIQLLSLCESSIMLCFRDYLSILYICTMRDRVFFLLSLSTKIFVIFKLLYCCILKQTYMLLIETNFRRYFSS